MQILVETSRFGRPALSESTSIVLRADSWNDYGYETLYHVELYQSNAELSELGTVKIMKSDMSSDGVQATNLKSGKLSLDDSYCSLGQATSYYENLRANLDDDDFKQYLSRLRDVVFDLERYERFKDHTVFQTSLVREGSARRALTDARDFILGRDASSQISFSFESSVGGTQFETHFRFGDNDEIPSRINAIIGYNGVGKTQLMANLSHVAWRDTTKRREIAQEHGRIIPESIPFGRVVAISYSAFDTFEMPTQTRQYAYRGLRHADLSAQGVASGDNRLKSREEILQELQEALERLKTEDRWQSLNVALAPMLREPSFQNSSLTLDFRASADSWVPVFKHLSTGHQISLNILVQLVAQLENKSLVLIDEPESHLHPPLLAALMKGISVALEETNSFAIIATHSPVVLQEISARYVQVLRRFGDITRVEIPQGETFGENVGILTRTVFNLDNAESDYQGILRHLAATHGLDGLAEIFPMGLSSQALAIVMEEATRIGDDSEGL